MPRFTVLDGRYTLALAVAVILVMNAPALAAMDAVSDHGADMVTHDYILDKQDASRCSMVQMTDEELSEVTATGFSSFSVEDNIIKAYFNIQTSTYTEIESLKMGYYDNGSGLGWDQDWEGVSLGSPTQDLVCNGLYIEAKFSSLADPDRTLDYLRVGTSSMTGSISASFNSFSGYVDSVSYSRQSLGDNTITCGDQCQFYLQLALNPPTGQPQGWYVYFSNATLSVTP